MKSDTQSYVRKEYIKNYDMLSKPIYNMKVEKDAEILLSDSIKLKADIYRPDDDGEFPALISWSPFSKEVQFLTRESISIQEYMFDNTIVSCDIEFFVRRGYIVIIPDPRGIGKSKGQWKGMYSEQDQRDCYEVIEWSAKQKWCTSGVAMIGLSYAGAIQPLVAALNPPSLKTIMPLNVIDDLYQHSYPGGIEFDRYFYFLDILAINNSISESELIYTKDILKKMLVERVNEPDINSYSNFVRVLDCWPPRYHTFLVDVLLHPFDGEFWNKRSVREKLSQIKIPVYIVSEYFDFGRFTDGAFNTYMSKKLNVPKKLMITGHHRDLKLPYKFANLEMLRWYDHWLKKIDTGIMEEPPIKINVMEKDEFRYENEWPLKRTDWTKLYLNSGKLTFNSKECNETHDTLVHRPPTQNPHKWSEVESLKYNTDNLNKDIEITGPLSVKISAAIDKNDANFIVKLWDVNESNNRTLVSTGHLKASHRELSIKYTQDHIPANDHSKAKDVEKDEIINYEFSMISTSYVFKKGHKIQVEIKSMDIQRKVDNERTSLPLEDLGGRMIGVLPRVEEITYKIFTGSEKTSYIMLPIINTSDESTWI